MYKVYLFCFCQLLICLCATAQIMLNKDSLLRLLPSVGEDTAAVDFYISLGQQYENNESERAKYYYRKARDISQKIDYPPGIIRYINNYTYVLNLQGRYDSSLLLNLEGVELARQTNDSLNLAKTLVNTGTSYRNLSRLEEAVKYYEEGKRILEKYMDDAMAASLADILQLLYKELKQYDKAISYGKHAVDYFRRTDNKLLLAFSLSNLALSYINKQEFSQGLTCLNETLTLAEEIKDTAIITTCLLNLGDIYLKLGEYDKMEPYFKKAYSLNEKLNRMEEKVIILRSLSLVEMSKRNYKLAKEFAEQSLTLAKKNSFLSEQQKTLETLSSIYYALHNMPEAEKHLQQAKLIADSILNETITRNTIETEKLFELEKMELTISRLESEKEVQRLTIKQKNTFNGILIGGLASLVIIALLAMRNYRHKQQLQLQRIAELEIEKQLAATEAVLEGEEQERSRLARDLHDGLGGMLSGIKFSFNTMKGNLIMTPENAQAFERSMDMLDSSIKEMRRVAHNLMPEVLIRYGLDKALKDYTAEINKSGVIKVIYQSMGMEKRKMDNSAELTLYRVVQELINNAIKHAAASEVLVQVFSENDKLVVNVEDNGTGINTSELEKTAGMGWRNIRSRVDLLKGKIDIHSSAGKGTAINLEFTEI